MKLSTGWFTGSLGRKANTLKIHGENVTKNVGPHSSKLVYKPLYPPSTIVSYIYQQTYLMKPLIRQMSYLRGPILCGYCL